MEKKLDGYMFKGTRVPVGLLLVYLRDGLSINEFLEDFPSVKDEDIERVLNILIVRLRYE